jgi:hypothetical protein
MRFDFLFCRVTEFVLTKLNAIVINNRKQNENVFNMKLPAVVANFNVFIFLYVVEVIISVKGFSG